MGIKKNGNNGVSLNYNFSYVVIGLLFILILGFSIFYFLYYLENKEIKLTDVVLFATGSVAILTLIYHSLSLESSAKFHKDNLQLQINEYSFKVSGMCHSKEMMDTMKYFQKLKNDKKEELHEKNIKKFIEYLDENVEDRVQIATLLNYFEHIAILVEAKHVNEHIIKEFFKSLFTETYILLKFYIDERQRLNPQSWTNFEKLSKKWRIEK